MVESWAINSPGCPKVPRISLPWPNAWRVLPHKDVVGFYKATEAAVVIVVGFR